MPIKELEKYEGTNPKPVDFDEYWDNAIKEMKAVNPKVEFIKKEFEFPGAECYDMYFTGVNGARVYAKHIRPKNITGKIPAILLFHGYSGHSTFSVISRANAKCFFKFSAEIAHICIA